MQAKTILVVRRILFWTTVAISATVTGLVWWYYIMTKLNSTLAPEVIILGIDRGETVVLLLAILCSCIPIAMWTGGQPLQAAEIERSFCISMDHVTRAYTISHQEDRTGRFTLSSQFDAMRERMGVLLQHPDLEALTPDLRVVAAQMSVVSRDLAQRYSDQTVKDAYALIDQCERDCERLEKLITVGLKAEVGIREQARRVDIRLATANSQLQSIVEAIDRELEPLNLSLNQDQLSSVVNMKTAAE